LDATVANLGYWSESLWVCVGGGVGEKSE